LWDQVWLEKRYVGSRHTSEWFNTAGRNVKTGLIASVVVSQVISTFLAHLDGPDILLTYNFHGEFFFFFFLFYCSGHGLLQSCKVPMLLGNMVLAGLSGMLVGLPSRYLQLNCWK
jgi:hypothetical protein